MPPFRVGCKIDWRKKTSFFHTYHPYFVVQPSVIASNAKQSSVEEQCAQFTDGKTIKKVIYITGKLINFIV